MFLDLIAEQVSKDAQALIKHCSCVLLSSDKERDGIWVLYLCARASPESLHAGAHGT